MQARQQKALARYTQVLTFLDANTSLIPPSLVALQRQVLASAVAQINGFAQDQVRKGTETVLAQSLPSARTALRDTYMRQVATVGTHTLTGQHAGDPDIANARLIFTLPGTRTNALTLIASAQAMVAAATPYATVFAANGVNLDAVSAATDALQAAVTADSSAMRVKKGATQGIKAQIRVAHGAVRVIDVVIRPLLAGDKPLLTQWQSVKRAAGALNLGAPVPVPPAVLGGTTAAAPQLVLAAGTSSPASSDPATSAAA